MNKIKFLMGSFKGVEFAINALVASDLPEVTEENKPLYDEGVAMGVFTEADGTYTKALEGFDNIALESVTPLSNEVAFAVITSNAEG